MLAAVLRSGGCVRAALRAGQTCRRMRRLVGEEAGTVWSALYGPYMPPGCAAGLTVRAYVSVCARACVGGCMMRWVS